MLTEQTLIQNCIKQCQHQLAEQKLIPRIHFELEGFCLMPPGQTLNYLKLNHQLKTLQITGQVKPEYWPGQWEYVSNMDGQTPLQEAATVAHLKQLLPELMRQLGATQVLLKPVIWNGSNVRYVPGSGTLFGQGSGSVHIPNAIQINVSIEDQHGTNLMANSGLGEWIQYYLLKNSYACCLLFLPEEEAFERLKLRTEFGLDAELSSPWELSGGYQGSIALYKEKGKHNQPLNFKPLVLDAKDQTLSGVNDWQSASRLEHRLGATSAKYDPFINVLFILVNVLDAVSSWRQGKLAAKSEIKALPQSLADKKQTLGALSLFKNETWFCSSLNRYCQELTSQGINSPGQQIKQNFLKGFQPNLLS